MTENGVQKIVDNDPNHERSLKFRHAIQNATYKNLYQEKYHKLNNRVPPFFKPRIAGNNDALSAATAIMTTMITKPVRIITYFTITLGFIFYHIMEVYGRKLLYL